MRSSQAECIRRFKYKVLPGQEAAYADYLRDVVEPIDHMAFADDAFLEVFMMYPMQEDTEDIQCRVFLFRDEAQFKAFPALMAKAAAQFDGNAAATEKRKAYAETLRALVGVQDYRLQR